MGRSFGGKEQMSSPEFLRLCLAGNDQTELAGVSAKLTKWELKTHCPGSSTGQSRKSQTRVHPEPATHAHGAHAHPSIVFLFLLLW